MALAPHRPHITLQRIAELDEVTLARIANARTVIRTSTMRVITSTPVWLTVLLSVLAFFDERSFIRGALAGGMAAGLASLMVQAVKFTVRRARPNMAYCIAKTLDRYSFPSGHSCTAFTVAGAALVVCPAFFPVVLLAAAVVAFSRVYLGVHYPSDVLTGAAMGLVVGAFTFSLGLAGGAASMLLG